MTIIKGLFDSFQPKQKWIFCELEIASRILKNSWKSIQFTENLELINENIAVENKIFLIQQLAKNIFFLQETIQWEKKCCGHKMRFNVKALNNDKANELIIDLKNKFIKDPTININSIQAFKEPIPKRNNKYDVRISFVHKDNSPTCNSSAKEIISYELRRLDTVLSAIEQRLDPGNLGKDQQIKIIYTFLFEQMIF